MTWGKRIVLVVLILGGILYGVLSMAQRSPDALRKGLEDYISQTTGQRGEITDLSEVRLVPDAYFDMKGVYVRDRKTPKDVYLKVKTARISLPFWRMMTGSTAFHMAEITGLETASGFLLPKKLTLDFLGISDPVETAAPQLMAEGRYNDLPLLATMEIQRKHKGGKPLYNTGAQSMITFKLGETEGESLLKRGFLDVSLESARLERDGIEAQFTAENLHAEPLNVKIHGRIEGADFNAVLTREGDNTVFRLTPATSSAEDAHKIKRFVDLVSGDLGLTDEKNVKIEIISPETHSEDSK